MKSPSLSDLKQSHLIHFTEAGEDIFFQEWLAADQPPEQISISGVCNARCLFCSNRMNPFPIRKDVFRDINSIKLQLSRVSANYDGTIHMSDALPGRISEGEAFLHPQFFDILGLIREKYITNVLHFTTNASRLEAPFIRKLAPFRPAEINVSMHSSQPKLWSHIFRKPEKRARIALNSLDLLKKHCINFTGTIVPLPRICGWDDIEQTFTFLVAKGAKSVLLWQPGHSEKTPARIQKEIECPWEEFQDFVKRMRDKFPGYPIIPQPDMSGLSKLPVKRIINSTLQGNLKTHGGAFHRVLWLVSEFAYPEISRLVRRLSEDASNTHNVFPVKNRSYGGNIRVSGLLMVPDFVAAGEEALQRWPATDLVLVPKTPYDAFLRDLCKTPAYRIPEILERTTWIVYENGSYHPLRGRGFIKPENDTNNLIVKILKHFDDSMRDSRWQAIVSMVAAFPIPTSAGPLKRAAFKDFLKRERVRLFPPMTLEKRVMEKLDERRILCMEEWHTAVSSRSVARWFVFRNIDHQWTMEMIFFGNETADPLQS